MVLNLAPAPALSLHVEVAHRLDVALVASHPQVGPRSLVVVEHPDGCRSVVVVVHHSYGVRAWPEVALDRIERSQIRHPELDELWFVPSDVVAALPSGCAAHTSSHWRAQHLPSQRPA